MGLITETNAQYYSGQQSFPVYTAITNKTFDCTFDVDVVSAFDSAGSQIGSVSNYTIYLDGVAQDEDQSYISTGAKNQITLRPSTFATTTVYVQLKDFAIQSNYGGYSYISLNDVINNFLVGYVGVGKLIPRVNRTDVMFHAKRGLQEFSYDTLKSIKSQELNIPPSLSVPIPQDYVNYVKASWVDGLGVTHVIYPTTLTTNPYTLPIQDSDGVPTQDAYGNNIDATQSLTEENWATANDRLLSGNLNLSYSSAGVYDWRWDKIAAGERYGLNPETSQKNGWFTINEREGKFSFSSNLKSRLIVLEYLSDGLAWDLDSKIPKMAEQAIYMHIAHGILASRSNVPEYIVRRFKKDRYAELRNAKIRLSNIKLDEIVQVMRGKSKWIKH